MRKSIFLVLLLSGLAMTGAASDKKLTPLGKQIARFAPTVVTGDTSVLSAGDRAALKKLIAAAKIFDRIYTRQIWSGNERLRAKLESDKSPGAAERLHYFNINRAPWSSLDHDEPFIAGVPAKPQRANY